MPPHAFRTAVVREMLARQVNDLLAETAARLRDHRVRGLDDVRGAVVPLVALSEPMARQKAQLARFLRERVYCHHRVLRMTANGKRVLKALFAEYLAAPELLPERHLRRWAGSGAVVGPPAAAALAGRTLVPDLAVVVGDYLAGMTDRFAQQEYRRLFAPTTDL